MTSYFTFFLIEKFGVSVQASQFCLFAYLAAFAAGTLLGGVAGIFFGLMFGLGGIGSALFGWIADHTGVEYIFRLSAWLPLLGIIAVFLPDVKAAGKVIKA